MTMFGAIYHLLPGVVGFALAFPEACPLAVLAFDDWCHVVCHSAGDWRGGSRAEADHRDCLSEANQAALLFFRISTTGLLLVLLGNLLFALNIFALTAVWKLALAKNVIAM